MNKNQHVTRHSSGGWQVKGAGNSRATVRTSTQQQAIKIARSIAINQRSELIIHGTDGKIRTKDSFGRDPCKRQTSHRLAYILKPCENTPKI